MTALRVHVPGGFATVQDQGRRGRAHLGVSRSGAADRASLRLANRLVGNRVDAAGLEVLGGGAVLEAVTDCVVAVTGARCEVAVNGAAQGRNVALALRVGDVLRLGPTVAGVRAYVSLRGGVGAAETLGSRSYDQLGELGPPPLTAGDEVERDELAVASPIWEEVPTPDPSSTAVLRVTAGPRLDWLEGGLPALLASSWTVSRLSDRTGVRLEGAPLQRRAGDLPSEGTVVGGLQLPPDGRPILLGPDAGVTGGYPMLAVVVEADVDAIGQLAPGSEVRFRTG